MWHTKKEESMDNTQEESIKDFKSPIFNLFK